MGIYLCSCECWYNIIENFQYKAEKIIVNKTKLICFPYAGGSSMAFQRWKQYLDSQYELLPIDYPGHGGRGQEPFADDFEKLIASIYEEIKGTIIKSNYILFGHSMGAWIAYEIYRKVMEDKTPKPIGIIVSGRGAPNLDAGDDFFLSDNQLNWTSIISLGGTPKEVVENPKYREFFEPVLKSDFQLLKKYAFTYVPIAPPVYVLWGKDDKTVSVNKLMAWEKLAVDGIRVASFFGEHFYCFDESTAEVMSYINGCL